MTKPKKMIELLRSGHPCDEGGKPCLKRNAEDGCFCAELADTIEWQREIIEGLLANWPHTEIADYYMPRTIRAVLQKETALKRASELIN